MSPLISVCLIMRMRLRFRSRTSDDLIMPPSLTDFRVLSFDCYGTLIDWETGIFNQLQNFRSLLPTTHKFQNREELVGYFTKQLALEAEQPETPYNQILSQCYASLAIEAGVEYSDDEADLFGKGVGEWPAFADTIAGLQILKQRYKLVILSNVDNDNMRRTLAGPLAGVDFDGVVTAQDVGSYKPDHRNFEALLRYIEHELGLSRGEHLHVAKSLPVDHVPAKQLGINSAWIARGEDGNSAMGGRLEDLADRVAFERRFASIGEMATEVEGSFSE
ncbi:uncharacterized protein LTR77_001299 [Saxophila tyrrhenica]|uniref:Haloacid dehalogenase n=1 Tax=Saxophila tyrrhenica TaxID=1690608 RepID=A0AAV9PNB9_9PEZI|nr:hypothetical protein LTR77_001299 [Saxophila tyrrhenica]